jgi:adenine-specific DNA methylase
MTQTSFIETQFPVAVLNQESFAERNSKEGQPLTCLGKWWGRKPLVLVRSLIIGLLQPATANAAADREIFLRLMTCDPDGKWKRCQANGPLPAKLVYDKLTASERLRYFSDDGESERIRWKPRDELPDEDRLGVMRTAFDRMSHAEQLSVMLFVDQIDGPPDSSWPFINQHCGTHANSLPEWIAEMGQRRFGRLPCVGDAFCGGGSIPFEAARVGCAAFGSDLNPVAALFTWAGIRLVGGEAAVIAKARAAEDSVFSVAEQQLAAWGIEQHGHKRNHDGSPWTADMYLYCTEVTCPSCGWSVPVSPNWAISEYQRAARLVPEPEARRFRIEVIDATTDDEVRQAKDAGTVRDSKFYCPNQACRAHNQPLPITALRDGLRSWERGDLVPRSNDALRERLYCIRWVERYLHSDARGKSVERHRWHYEAPTAHDAAMEQLSVQLLSERLDEWQAKGYIPRRTIASGNETDRLLREKGFTYWHHLFHPRQLLIIGLLAKASENYNGTDRAALLTAIAKAAHYASRLSVWLVLRGKDEAKPVFINQAFNTLYNYALRGSHAIQPKFSAKIAHVPTANTHAVVQVADARQVDQTCDIWITDPPYADAVAYHELTEFFLGWFDCGLATIDSTWINDSRRPLAITGSGPAFRQAMADSYRNLSVHMPDNGMQVVMFTHQDASVWADLALILWAAGLQVSAAWCIATETSSPLKDGNYVQGTVLLILRKRQGQDTAYLEELLVPVEDEVRRQLDSMRRMDDRTSPMFSDGDYQLAAYAAALRVLTQYGSVNGIDIEREMHREGGENPVTRFIDEAVRLVADALVPAGLDESVWKGLGQEERFYLKALQTEKAGNQKVAVYQELARGFGCHDYKGLLASTKANAARLKNATEFGERLIGTPGDPGFIGSLTRHLMLAIRIVIEKSQPEAGSVYLRSAYGAAWWNHRQNAIAILDLLKTQAISCTEWETDSHAADSLAQFLRVSGGA